MIWSLSPPNRGSDLEYFGFHKIIRMKHKPKQYRVPSIIGNPGNEAETDARSLEPRWNPAAQKDSTETWSLGNGSSSPHRYPFGFPRPPEFQDRTTMLDGQCCRPQTRTTVPDIQQNGFLGSAAEAGACSSRLASKVSLQAAWTIPPRRRGGCPLLLPHW